MIRPVLRRNRRLVAFGLQSGADVGGAAVLPDDGAVHGLAGRAVPHHRGLALVGDADGGDVVRLQARPSPAPRGRPRPSRSRCPPARARPSRRPENAAGIPAAPWRRWRCRCGTRWRARTWCPDRWPAQRTWRCFPGGCWLAERQPIGRRRSRWSVRRTFRTSPRLRGGSDNARGRSGERGTRLTRRGCR